jgi:hypothetical protein
MKTFKHTAAQGEISIRKIDALPADVVPLKPENGHYVIGHSETGHHHVMTLDRKQVFEAKNPPAGMRVLYAILDVPADLIHQRGHDTHETIHHDAGIYEFRLGREFDPYAELARQVAD